MSINSPVNSTLSAGETYVAPGMPPLDLSGRTTSLFEFWPTWLMYVPVALLWVVLAIRHRSLSLPLIANPAIPLSGMVGVAKSSVFRAAGEHAQSWILPWVLYEVHAADVATRCEAAEAVLQARGLQYPVVGKPDIGCRGAGVKLLHDRAQLRAFLQAFPLGASVQFQQLSEWEAEAGVFYVRHPDANGGAITSLTLKYTPYVVGDGERTLAELIAADERAGELQHLYQQRHAGSWNEVIAVDMPYRLVFSASHCRGAVFRDGADLIDTRLTQALDTIFADIPEFYYGRLDIKFKDVESLRQGKEFVIIEINGASSESIHIWDRNATLSMAIRTLLQQYSTLFTLGAANRKRGYKPPGMTALIKAWRYESKLVENYPLND